MEQRIAVERAAAAVASARLEGARRADIKQLMATYREAAQRLAALEAAAAPSPDQTAESFRQAQVDVAAAVAVPVAMFTTRPTPIVSYRNRSVLAPP